MAKGKTNKIVVELHEPQPKKNVTRYDSIDPKADMLSAYVNKDALERIGNPAKIKVTIETTEEMTREEIENAVNDVLDAPESDGIVRSPKPKKP